jgi:hypothetical protein
MRARVASFSPKREVHRRAGSGGVHASQRIHRTTPRRDARRPLVSESQKQGQIGAFLPLKICYPSVRCNRLIDTDRSETTEGHHAWHDIDDIGPDQHGEDESQRAACTPRYRTGNGRHSVDRLETAERVLTRQQDAALEESHIGCRRRNKSRRYEPGPQAAAKGSRD